MQQAKPIIGITLDFQHEGGYSSFPWYALRENYFKAVEDAGGIPIGIPYCHDAITSYMSMINGLVVPGGPHDINPEEYGEFTKHEKVMEKQYRTSFDRIIIQAALDLKKPLLTICAGEQMLNVVLGGSLWQHIPDDIPEALNHELSATPHLAAHTIIIDKDTLLYDIAGVEEAWVNSTHHQAVNRVGQGLIVNARAPDGVVEGIELKDHPFCLGVEWHPEHSSVEFDRAIFKRLIVESLRA